MNGNVIDSKAPRDIEGGSVRTNVNSSVSSGRRPAHRSYLGLLSSGLRYSPTALLDFVFVFR